MTRNFGVANDGTSTRVNLCTGGGSSPDVTLIHQSLMDKVEWSCLDDMGSDHLPILVELECGVAAVKPVNLGLRWSWRKADWEGYRQEMEHRTEQVKDEIGQWSISKKASYVVDQCCQDTHWTVQTKQTKGNKQSLDE